MEKMLTSFVYFTHCTSLSSQKIVIFCFIIAICIYILVYKGRDFNIEHQMIQYINHELYTNTAIHFYKLNIVVQNSFYNRLEIRNKNPTLLLYRIVFQMRWCRYCCVYILYNIHNEMSIYDTQHCNIKHREASEPRWLPRSPSHILVIYRLNLCILSVLATFFHYYF